MKFFFIPTYFLIAFISYSQDNYPVSAVSKNRDTLWLLNNDTGKLIADSWEISPVLLDEKKPVIIFVEILPIITNSRNKKKKYYRG